MAPVERGEIPVVDHGAHGDAETGPEQDPQRDRHDDGDDEDDEAVVGDIGRADLEALAAEEGVDLAGGVLAPDLAGESQQEHHQTDGHHQLVDQWRLL